MTKYKIMQCVNCGRKVKRPVHTNRARCAPCRRQYILDKSKTEWVRRGMRGDKSEFRPSGNGSGSMTVTIVRAQDFAGRICGWRETLRMGNAEPGMVVEWRGAQWRVEGAEGAPQWMVRL